MIGYNYTRQVIGADIDETVEYLSKLYESERDGLGACGDCPANYDSRFSADCKNCPHVETAGRKRGAKNE